MVDRGAGPVPLNPDVERWLEQRQRALHITTTTITPAGQTLDWVPIEREATAAVARGGLTVDHNLNGDGANHLSTYYTTNEYSQDGNNLGGYNRLQSGWVQYNPSIFPPIRINGTSAEGHSPQLEIGVKYQLWQGNWWFGFNNNESGPWIWLGYDPGSLFGGGSPTRSGGRRGLQCARQSMCATTDQMGSGRHAVDGWTHACYQRPIHNQTNPDGALANFDGIASVDVAASNCPTNAYTIETFMNSGSSWGRYQFFGGPAA
ncbi:MAG: neprosin family prolyl endopeptidase [Solirubrobacteraceae bacterium]